MKLFVRFTLLLVLAIAANPLAARDQAPAAPAGRELPKPNYDLASRWTSAKVGKYVFSTAVTPHWLEFSDRFWYSYETPAGEKWWMVDPVKKTKTPLLDNAKMAAQLTRILRTPYDAQHLPITTIRFIDNDTKIRFSVTLPRDSRVENADGPGNHRHDAEAESGAGRRRPRRPGRRRRQRQQQQQQGGRAGGQGANAGVGNATWWLEYDFATRHRRAERQVQAGASRNPNWASVSPDKQTIVFARGFNLFMMDADELRAGQEEAPDDPAIVETQLTTDGERYYGVRPRRRRRQPGPAAGQHDRHDGSAGRRAAAARSSRARPTRSSARATRRRRVLVAGQQEVLDHAHRSAQGRRPLGHQLAGESAADARDLQVRDARRGEPAAGRAARRRHRRQEGAEALDRRVQGSADGRWRRRRRRTCSARRARRRRAGCCPAATRSTSTAPAAI